MDRELIFPKALDKIFPSWLNHLLVCKNSLQLPVIIAVIIILIRKHFEIQYH